VLVFAYGTLKDPAQRAAVLGSGVRCRVIGAGHVRGVLYNVGEFPALRPTELDDDRVPGLLLELDDSALARLDAYEGIDESLYVRERWDVRVDDGSTAAAWVYIYNRPIAGLRRIAAWPPT
jgi:gamma-glutamylcyclotransferase (GGCT)/AIG2-like uncharacterized protein YtfP